MEIHAYNEVYLESAQNILGHMFDFAVNELGLDIDDYADRFIVSGISAQMETGNPAFIAGKTGPEIVRLVMETTGYNKPFPEEIMYIDRSPEYWSGWALAYYQWVTAFKFSHIFSAVSVSKVREMYGIFHEMDIVHFAEEMDRRIKEYYPETALKRFRTNLGVSQRELSLRSGVPLRQIQLFEQKQRDISKAAVNTVIALSRALSCEVNDLVE